FLRPNSVSAISSDADGSRFVERVNYNSDMNGGLTIYGRAGDDTFVLDENNVITTIFGDEGNDNFQVGQVFASLRDANAGLALEDQFDATLTTRGYLSNGISYSTNLFGGVGEDSFTVYHNKADLSMFGEEDDDSFRVRAFVRVNPRDPKAPLTNINGGQGADFISYTVNSPVQIEGGDGFDSLTVVGTEFGDQFVVTNNGVFGAGLFVSFNGLERVVVDALEGNDTFYVGSSSKDVELELIGGRGSDTFDVGGSEDGKPVTVESNDGKGHSGLIDMSIENGTYVPDVSINVLDNDEGRVVITQGLKSDSDYLMDLRVFEGGGGSDVADLVHRFYTVVLTRAITDNVYVTAKPSSRRESEVRAGGRSIALNGSESGITLVFDRTNWFEPQVIEITAPQDAVAEGMQDVNIQHSVRQGATEKDGDDYDAINVASVSVQVVDDDVSEVLVAPGDETMVIEGGAGSSYEVVLTRAPLGNVTIALGADAQINDGTDPLLDTGLPTVNFTSTNWNVPKTVTIGAFDDGITEGLHYSRITHTLEYSSDPILNQTNRTNFLNLTKADAIRGLALQIAADDYDAVQSADSSGNLLPSITVTRTLTQGGGFTANTAVKLKGSAIVGQTWSIRLVDETSTVATATYTWLGTEVLAVGQLPLAYVAQRLANSLGVSAASYTFEGSGNGLVAVTGAPPTVDFALTDTLAGSNVNVVPFTAVTAASDWFTAANIEFTMPVSAGAAAPLLGNPEFAVLINGQTYSHEIDSSTVGFDQAQDVVQAIASQIDNTLYNVSSMNVGVNAWKLVISRVDGAAFNARNVEVPGGMTVVSSPVTSADLAPNYWSEVSFNFGTDAAATIAEGSVWSVNVDGKVYTYIAGAENSTTLIEAVDVTIVDDDVLGVIVSEAGGSTQVTEPTDRVVFGGGKVSEAVADGAVLEVSSTTALASAEIVVFSSGDTQSSVRTTVSLTSDRFTATLALSGEAVEGENWYLVLNQGNDSSPVYRVYHYAVGVDTTLATIAQGLVTDISTATPAHGITANARAVSQFEAGFGSPILFSNRQNNSLFDAQSLDYASWSNAENPDFFDGATADVTPHVTVKGSGTGELDYYSFTVDENWVVDESTSDVLGLTDTVRATFDIDHGYDVGDPQLWGSRLFLYKFDEASNNYVLQRVGPGSSSPSTGGDGSGYWFDDYLTADLLAGEYVIGVSNWLYWLNNYSRGIPEGVDYELNISIAEHPVSRFVFAPAPVQEDSTFSNGGTIAVSLSPTNVLTVSGTSGNYYLSDAVNNVALPWNADAVVLEQALEKLVGAGNVISVTPVTAGSWQITLEPSVTSQLTAGVGQSLEDTSDSN
ncbi:MAG: hypothetical protein ACI9HK_005462, partial [Pirellulaceae bacterium]